jgi:uncharacterized protein
MKIHPDVIPVQSVHSYGPDWVRVDDQTYTSSLVMDSRGERFLWDCAHFEDLQPAHFEQLANLAPEMVIFGSGARLRFVAPDISRSLIEHQIGLETMDTQAACRTYNILASEGRHVALAVLIEAKSVSP